MSCAGKGRQELYRVGQLAQLVSIGDADDGVVGVCVVINLDDGLWDVLGLLLLYHALSKRGGGCGPAVQSSM